MQYFVTDKFYRPIINADAVLIGNGYKHNGTELSYGLYSFPEIQEAGNYELLINGKFAQNNFLTSEIPTIEYIPPTAIRTKKCDGCYQKEYTQDPETFLSKCNYCGLNYEGNEE